MDFLARLAAPRELVKADGRDRPERPTPATTGKKKGINGRLVVITDRGDADQRVDQPGEEEVAAQVAEIVPVLA